MKEALEKIPVARRQLHAAIGMYFQRDDAVAIHTLAAASHQILYDLASAADSHGLIRRPQVVREDKLDEWNRQLNVPQNFFKHADRDPKSTIEFDPAIAEVFLFDAIVLLQELKIGLSVRERLYSIWFGVKHPGLLVEGEYRDSIEAGIEKGINPDDFESVWAVLLEFERQAQQNA